MHKVYKKITNILLSRYGLYLVTLLVHVIVIPFYSMAIVPDEVNPLAVGFMLRGENWSQFLIADGYYYKYGQLFFQLPFIVLIKNNYILYRVLLLINAFVVSFIPVCAYVILTKYISNGHTKINYLVALIVGFIPSVLLDSKMTWAEPFLLIIPWLIILLYSKVMDESISNCKKWIYSSLLAVLQVYAYMVHTRGLIILIAALLCTLYIRIILKEKNIKLIPYFIVMIILYFTDSLLGKIIKSYLYNGNQNLIGNSTSFINSEFLHNITSLSGIKVFGEEIIGWLFASVSSTFGLSGLGLMISIAILIKVRNWKEYSHQELAIILFSLLFFGGSLVMGTLFFFNDLYVSAGMEIARRGDKIIYTRYLEPASICMSFLGLYYSLVKKGFRVKNKIIYSVAFFLLLNVFFIGEIAERINNTITWVQVSMTINYLCDFSQCVRGGAYSIVGFFSGGIAFFGLFAMIVYATVIRYRRNKKFFFATYLICFMVCYFLSAYNVLHKEHSYQENLIKEYEDIIKCVSGENGNKNIYVEDEILRSGFQYVFSDYYILTDRDDNRFFVDEMFMMSPNESYNEELYNGDYYEIVYREKVNEDYHLYIKGDSINEILNKNGYVTRKVSR